jgi:oxygen-independent coproporphyrinogen-3 oxidase
MSSLFGIYIHIPYCIQRCSYCDFATYEQSQILPPQEYVEVLKNEIRAKQSSFPLVRKQKPLHTIYFGGGTPSLIPAELIVSLIEELSNQGFQTGPETEITLEINPATLNPQKMEQYLKAGINRFSVGAQTFDDTLLKSVHREHNAQQTLETLSFLNSYGLNYSFDILFALPGQTLDMLKRDLDIGLKLGAKHISPYCLTVPNTHPLSKSRPPEDEQVAMFELIDQSLVSAGFNRYEISNYSLPGFESQHNLLYWTDQPYWGLGLSAHSYEPNTKSSKWGARYWNPSNMNQYLDFAKAEFRNADGPKAWTTPFQFNDESLQETLEEHSSLTDFCHTSLRLSEGLKFESGLNKKFSSKTSSIVNERCKKLLARDLLKATKNGFSLSNKGLMLSNLVFAELTFLKEELN